MTTDVQTIFALLLVALASGWLVWRVVRRRKTDACGGCGPDRFKQDLHRRRRP